MDRDERIDEIYNYLEEECTERGKKLLLKYSDEIAYRESDDADFYYESGFLDGVALIAALQKNRKRIFLKLGIKRHFALAGVFGDDCNCKPNGL